MALTLAGAASLLRRTTTVVSIAPLGMIGGFALAGCGSSSVLVTTSPRTQQLSTKRLIAAPQSVRGIGLDADWYPNAQQLQTTDGHVLMTVTITWKGVSQARRRALAVAVARPYLRPRRSHSR